MNQRSLVLVTVDCLRADRVGFGGYSRPLTPFLDSLAQSTIVFPDAIVGGAPTYFSFPAIMASRYPLALGRDVLGIAPGEETLASTLQETGYETAAFIAGNPYLTRRFGYDQGFRQFVDFLGAESQPYVTDSPRDGSARWSGVNRRLAQLSRGSKITASAYQELYFWYCQWRSSRSESSMDQLRRYPSADVLVDSAIEWLKGVLGRRFFLWIHLMDPHHPYYPPKEALQSLGITHIDAKRARFLNSFWNRFDVSPKRLQDYQNEVMTLYDAGVHWVDQQLSRLVDALAKSGRWDDTVFAVTADHGEEFLEHGHRYHSARGLSEELIRVPLLVHASEISARMTVAEPFSLIHLAPTLLEAVGSEVPATFQGSGLWKEISTGGVLGLPAIVESGSGYTNYQPDACRVPSRLMTVRTTEYKLVLRFGESREDLYNLKHEPGERQPLPAGSHVEQRARLLQCAAQHLRSSREWRDAKLALRARVREIRQRIDSKGSSPEECSRQSAAEIRQA